MKSIPRLVWIVPAILLWVHWCRVARPATRSALAADRFFAFAAARQVPLNPCPISAAFSGLILRVIGPLLKLNIVAIGRGDVLHCQLKFQASKVVPFPRFG